jgi:hypothetical protein
MQHICPIYCGVILESDAAVAMIGVWIRSCTSREDEQATHNGEEDPVPVPVQESEDASPTEI